MRAGGLSGLRLMAPFVLFGFIASLVNLFLTQNVVPVSHRSFSRELAQASGQGTKTILRRLVLEPAYDADGALKRLIHVGVFDLKDLYARDVAIVEFKAGRPRSVIQADEMAWDGRAWQFRRGWITRLDEGGGTSRLTVREGRVDYQPLLPKPREIALSATDPLNMNWFEFKEFIAKRQRDGKDVRRFLVELYTRLALPFACLALAVAGTPLGVQPHRSGSAVSFGLAMAVLLFYYFLLSFGQVLGSSGVLPPVLAAWSANLILCGAGIGFFFWRLR